MTASPPARPSSRSGSPPLQLDAPRARITLEIADNYRNMRSQIAPHPHIVELAKAAMEAADVVPKIKPIRGGTDGARLSFMGLPCPNLFTGGHNFHGKHEFIPCNPWKSGRHPGGAGALTSAWRAE